MANGFSPDASKDTIREYEDCKVAVRCPICQDSLTNARRLSCSHTFCLECLNKYQTSYTANTGCPTCRDLTVPTHPKLSGLEVNAFANMVAHLVRVYDPVLKSKGQMLQNKPQMQPGVPQQQNQPFNMIQQPSQSQYQIVWHGNLEFNERRSNMAGQSDRPVMMQAKIMADTATDLDLINSGGLSTWPQKIPIYPIPDVILSQSQECKLQLTSDTRKLSVIADNAPNSPFRGFVNMLIEKGMAGVVNMNSQNEYKIMVLLALKPTPNSAPTMKALLPKQQTLFYDEFKKSVHLYKEKTKQQQINRNVRPQVPMTGNPMPAQMPGGMMNQQIGQINPRMGNAGVQRPMNNMQTVMMGQQAQQPQLPGMMGNQMAQGGLQQPVGMQQQPMSQQMGNHGGNQAMMGQQIGVQQRPIQNQQIMRPQMTHQQMLQQRMVTQQQQGQQIMMQQPPNQQMMMGGQQAGMQGQQGQPMGGGTLDDIGLY